MSTQISPTSSTAAHATVEVTPVPLAERVKTLDKGMPRDEDRKEPAGEEAAVVIEQPVPQTDMLARNLSFGLPVVQPSPDGGEPEPVMTMAFPFVTNGRGLQDDRATILPRMSYPSGVAVAANHLADTPPAVVAVVAGRMDPVPLQSGGMQGEGRPLVRTATMEGANASETKLVAEAGTPSSETWPRTHGVDPIASRPPTPLTARVEGDAVAADESASPHRAEAGTSSTAMPNTPVPTPSGGQHETRSGSVQIPGQPQHASPTPPSQLPGQARHAAAPAAPSELTFTFNSWGHGQAVTATLARSGYVYLNPSSTRVGEALMASKPEERWLVERTTATGEDDNRGKQRRRRQ
jgi:hypothetical protein